MFLPGNAYSIDDVRGLSVIDSFAELAEQFGERIPSLRYIVWSAYDIVENGARTPYRPADLPGEGGMILFQSIKSLTAEYGRINAARAHSLGTLFFAAAFANAGEDNLAFIPRETLLDRGPVSIKEAAKLYYCGKALFTIGNWLGWGIDVEQTILRISQRHGDHHFTLLGVRGDHHFPDDISLANSRLLVTSHSLN